MERLDRILASQGVGSRSEVQRLIRSGRVTVNGSLCRSPAEKVEAEKAEIAVDGRPLRYQKHVYIMLHKPPGILCVSRDPKVSTVIDLLPPELKRRGLFPAGRLDKDTVGLVLITDDGDYAHRLLSPARAIYKRYQAVIDAPVTAEHVQRFAQGTSLSDGTRCLPAKLQILRDGDQPLVEVSICEGKYHQIKRMFGALDRKVLWLKRVSMGSLELDENLKEGECRLLQDGETALVFR